MDAIRVASVLFFPFVWVVTIINHLWAVCNTSHPPEGVRPPAAFNECGPADYDGRAGTRRTGHYKGSFTSFWGSNMQRLKLVWLAILLVTTTVHGAELPELKPGTKLIVQLYGEETIGEFVEQLSTGSLVVMIKTADGRLVKLLYKEHEVRLAPPGSQLGGVTAGTPAMQPDEPQPELSAALKPLVGSWAILRWEENGEAHPEALPYKIQFTPSSFHLGSLVAYPWYGVDGAQSPQHLDVGNSAAEVLNAGIVEVRGDTLRYCYALAQGAARPAQFATTAGDGYRLLVGKRVPDIRELISRPVVDPASELTLRLAEMHATLHDRGFVAFMNECVGPPREEAMSAEEEHELRATPQTKIDMVLGVLSALQRLSPTMSEDGSIATYDLTGWHMPGDVSNSGMIRLRKFDGVWYLLNR